MQTTARRAVVDRDVAAVIVCVAIGLYIALYLINVPGSAAAVQTSSGTSLYLATVPAAELTDPHNTWVSYYADNFSATQLEPRDHLRPPGEVPGHVTIYQFDAQTGLRNPFLGAGDGTVGGTFELNGKPTVAIDPDTASHVFAIPHFGLSVPLEGVDEQRQEPVQQRAVLAEYRAPDHHVHVPYRARASTAGSASCPAPPATSMGFGGPMQTVGYMDGFLKVV